MNMKTLPAWIMGAAGLGALLSAHAAPEITATDLAALRARGEAVVVIDVRRPSAFQYAHVPEAVNIPADLLPLKHLPPWGRVVVYDEGAGETEAVTAADDLNRRPGIRAEVLRGGYAAWQSATGRTTEARGLHPEALVYVSFDEAKKLPPDRVQVLELPAAKDKPPKPGRADDPDPVKRHFGKTRIDKSTDTVLQDCKRKGPSAEEDRVVVLVDHLDGEAEKTARILKANGVTRVVILAGGREILERDGKPGKERLGPGQGLKVPAGSKEGGS